MKIWQIQPCTFVAIHFRTDGWFSTRLWQLEPPPCTISQRLNRPHPMCQTHLSEALNVSLCGVSLPQIVTTCQLLLRNIFSWVIYARHMSSVHLTTFRTVELSNKLPVRNHTTAAVAIMVCVHWLAGVLHFGSSANHFLHRPFPFLPDWFHGLSDQRLDLFAWCVRLSRLWVGFWTHFKSLHFSFSFHFIHFNSAA